MKYLVQYTLSIRPLNPLMNPHKRVEYQVVDEASGPYAAMEHIWNMYSDNPLYRPTVNILAIYELREVPVTEWQDEFITNVGHPHTWELIGSWSDTRGTMYDYRCSCGAIKTEKL